MLEYKMEYKDPSTIIVKPIDTFMGIQTSIFVNNTKIMLIDESAKGTDTLSDAFYNVVYE